MDQRKFGFIGLGNMGRPMSSRFLKAGYRLAVLDLHPEAAKHLAREGATVVGSVSEMADAADIVFLALPTPDVVRAVAIGDGGLALGSRVKVVVDLSTSGPKIAGEVARGLAAAGKTLVDCPISGGPSGAAAGTLALMLAGDPRVVEDLAPYLAPFGRHFVVGDTPGQGQTLKILNNLLSTAALAISSEALVMGVKAGLDPDVMIEVFNAGSGRNTATTDKVPKHILPRSFDFGMPIGLSAKDARLCLEEADRVGVPMVVGSAVRQLVNIARDRLGADADMTEVIRVLEEWAGIEVRGKAAGSSSGRPPTATS
jgi:3-hydroxyisobutyrate dehydrogenase-like beta-hydroxyacid dehydrogenase